MAGPRLIAIDWGTSSFRAWAMTAEGEVLDARESGSGILAVEGGDFDAAFEAALGDWLAAAPEAPVIASGMITSRNGWCETPYLPLPVRAGDLARALTPLTTRQGRLVHFVTGIARDAERGLPDVMRGEETELAGHLAADGPQDGLYILPGTHSKWARARAGAIVDFETYMTGEFFAVLSRHSILGRLMAADAAPSPDAFAEGVAVARVPGASILSTAFSARTLALFGRLAAGAIGDYLSGLLVGSEIAGALARHPDVDRVTIIGRGDLCERYRAAVESFDIRALQGQPGMARLGLIDIARRAGMV